MTEAALLRRVNRQLEWKSEVIRKCRDDSPLRSELGEYYLVSRRTNSVIFKDLDLPTLARYLKVLT